MSFLQDIGRYPDILFPYLSNTGNRGHFVILFSREALALNVSLCNYLKKQNLIKCSILGDFIRKSITESIAQKSLKIG